MWDKEKLLRRLDMLTGDDRLYFLSYGLFLATSLLSASFFYKFYEGKACMWLQVLCIALLVGYECRNGFLKAQQWSAALFLGGMTLIAMVPAIGSQTRMVAMMFPYIYCARRIPFAKIARFTLKYSLILVFFVVISGYLGIIDNVVMMKAGRVREFLGFRYALYLPGILLNLTALWVWFYKDKIPVWGALVWAAVNWIVYYMTDSRISFFIAEGLLVAALLMSWMPKITHKLRYLWAALIPIFAVCGIGALYLTKNYNSNIAWMRRLNSMLEGRLNLGSKSLEAYGVKLFGQVIEWVGNGLETDGMVVKGEYTYVDCLYIKVLQRYGYVFLILLLPMLCWAMYRLWKRREYLAMVICASVAVHCVVDDLSLSLHYNTFWIAMGLAIIAPNMLNWNGQTTQVLSQEPQTE